MMNLSSILSKLGLKTPEGTLSNISVIKNELSQITIKDYLDIVFADNLTSLIISGKPTTHELTESKNMLLYEFSVACGSNVSIPVLHSYRKVHRCKNQIAALNEARKIIIIDWNKELTSFLQSMNVRVIHSDVNKTLQAINRKIKSIQVALQEENNRYDKLVSDNSPSNKMTLEDFERQISLISKYMGFKIDKDKTSLSEYASYIYSYKKEIENHGNRK